MPDLRILHVADPLPASTAEQVMDIAVCCRADEMCSASVHTYHIVPGRIPRNRELADEHAAAGHQSGGGLATTVSPAELARYGARN